TVSSYVYPVTTESDSLSLHDALPISHWLCLWVWNGAWFHRGCDHLLSDSLCRRQRSFARVRYAEGDGLSPTLLCRCGVGRSDDRSEEHTSELQSRENLVCRLLLDKKK